METPPIPAKIRRIAAQIFAVGALVGLFLLAASLSNLNFNPGQTLPVSNQRGGIPAGPLIEIGGIGTICFAAIMALVPIGLVMVIFSKDARDLFKRYFKVIFFWVAFLILMRLGSRQKENEELLEITQDSPVGLGLPEIPESIGLEETPIEIYAPPEVANWLGYLIGFLIIVLVGIVIYIWWEKNRQSDDDISYITLKTLKDISDGGQWEDAIIQCYADMTAVVRQQRRLHRDRALTASEFAEELQKAGLPSEPVQNLTRLFEKARYSNRQTQTDESTTAIQCLTEISTALEAIHD
jgi:hypothetical protein